MIEYGVTERGFRRKGYGEILEDLQAKARESYGENVNLSNSSYIGMSLQNQAWEMSNLWELAEEVYYAPFVDTASGKSLDSAGSYAARRRKPSQPSRGAITISGDNGTKVFRGFRVSDKDKEKIFETTKDVTIASSGTVDVGVVSIEPGSDMNVPKHTLIEVVNPISGVDSVINKSATENGVDFETDKEFRERYFKSLSAGGGATRTAVEAAILNVENVVDAFVVENDTDVEVDRIPPHSLYCLVEGATDETIANTILKSKAGGIQAYGDNVVEVEDSKGVKHSIGFSRPVKKKIYVKLDITRDDGYIGDEAVKRAVINYIGGLGSDGIFYRGLKLGEDVVVTRVTSNVMCLGGVGDMSVKLSLDNSMWSSSNIINEINEISETDSSRIVINYVE